MSSSSSIILLGAILAVGQGQFLSVPKISPPPAPANVPLSLPAADSVSSPFSLDNILSLSPADQLAQISSKCPLINSALSPAAILQNIKETSSRISASPIDGVQQGFTCLSALSRADYLGLLTAKPNAEALSPNRPQDDDEDDARRKKRAAPPPPPSIDWRDKGQVNEVQDQGLCGSCWTFSANAALEAAIFRKTKKLPKLSEQSLVDCVKNAKGCSGGWMTDAYARYNASGPNDALSYPYDGKEAECKSSDSADKKWSVLDDKNGKGYSYVKDNEEALKKKLAAIGPIAAAIDSKGLQDYTGGIYSCKEFNAVDHAILVVGYGTTEDGQDYWLVRNSWGKTWGEEGYFRIVRGKGNELACGLPLMANYPIMSKD